MIIVPAIGAFQDEVDSYKLAKILLWLPPLLVTLASLSDFCLFLLYNRFGHPWKDILLKDVILDIVQDLGQDQDQDQAKTFL